ncbi:hypothetical protein WJX77_008698 [Trebouxia sp. C0004]
MSEAKQKQVLVTTQLQHKTWSTSVDPVLLKKHSTDTMDSIIKDFELAFPRPLMLQQDIVSRFKSLKGKPGSSASKHGSDSVSRKRKAPEAKKAMEGAMHAQFQMYAPDYAAKEWQDWKRDNHEPRRNRSPSSGASASERQQLALHSFSTAATDLGNGTRFHDELVLLQAQLQSAADLGTTNRAPSSVWALQSALYAGQQREELNPQPFCAESHKPGAVLFDSPYLSELDPSANTGYFQGPTTSDRFCREDWLLFARSSAQAGTVGVTADGQRRRNAFDEGRRSDDICATADINRASQH